MKFGVKFKFGVKVKFGAKVKFRGKVKFGVKVKVNVCVVASGYARWSMCVCGCISLRQMCLLTAPTAPVAE